MSKPALVVLCGACVLASSAGSAVRSTACASGMIAFQRAIAQTEESGSDTTDVWVVQADGSGQRNLTGGDQVFLEGGPAWSPDGRSIAYTSFGVPLGTYTMNANGRQVRRITGVESWDPTWAPDGRALAVASRNFPNGRVGVVSVRGGSLRWLTLNGLSGDPAWSSRGQIAFAQITGSADATLELFVTSAAGKVKRQLTRNRELEEEPAWSPDGSRIAYRTTRGIYIMNADGSAVRRLTHGRYDYVPAWSPDGRCIAFRRSEDIVVVSVAGGVPRRLMTHKPKRTIIDGEPAWSAGTG